MVEMYCVKCRQKRVVKEYVQVLTKNGRHAIKASCPTCHTKMFKFVKASSSNISGKGFYDQFAPNPPQFVGEQLYHNGIAYRGDYSKHKFGLEWQDMYGNPLKSNNWY